MKIYRADQLNELPDGEYVLERYWWTMVKDGKAQEPQLVYRVVAQGNEGVA